MTDSEETVPAERLRYVSAMLNELARMLPPPQRSLLAHLVHMACLEAKNEIARGDSRQP